MARMRVRSQEGKRMYETLAVPEERLVRDMTAVNLRRLPKLFAESG